MTKALRQWLKTDQHAARGHWQIYDRVNNGTPAPPPRPEPTDDKTKDKAEKDASRPPYTDDNKQIKTGSHDA